MKSPLLFYLLISIQATNFTFKTQEVYLELSTGKPFDKELLPFYVILKFENFDKDNQLTDDSIIKLTVSINFSNENLIQIFGVTEKGKVTALLDGFQTVIKGVNFISSVKNKDVGDLEINFPKNVIKAFGEIYIPVLYKILRKENNEIKFNKENIAIGIEPISNKWTSFLKTLKVRSLTKPPFRKYDSEWQNKKLVIILVMFILAILVVIETIGLCALSRVKKKYKKHH